MSAPRYNSRSPAVKRLMREAAELHQPTYNYFAQPVEDNLFEWHFTIRGPADTPFAKGIFFIDFWITVELVLRLFYF